MKEEQNNFELSDEEKQNQKNLQASLPEFIAGKVVDKNTPFSYMTQAISDQLKAEDKGNANFSHAVMLFNEDKEEFQKILENAGYEVKELPSEIL